MTEDEAASMFDSWGGGLRELCERGFVCYTAGPEKALRLCPPLEPLSAHAAQLTLARRYFTHYAPATIHDAMYFFHASAKAVRGWLAELPRAFRALQRTGVFLAGWRGRRSGFSAGMPFPCRIRPADAGL